MPLVSPIIETAAGLVPDSLYLRATDTQANIEVDEIDLEDKVAILYNNLPTVKHAVSAGGVIRRWPVEIKILKLAQADDNDVNGDVIRAALLPYADLMFDAILKDQRVSLADVPSSYDIDFLDVVRIYDNIMTGLVIKFSISISRANFCIPETP